MAPRNKQDDDDNNEEAMGDEQRLESDVWLIDPGLNTASFACCKRDAKTGRPILIDTRGRWAFLAIIDVPMRLIFALILVMAIFCVVIGVLAVLITLAGGLLVQQPCPNCLYPLVQQAPGAGQGLVLILLSLFFIEAAVWIISIFTTILSYSAFRKSPSELRGLLGAGIASLFTFRFFVLWFIPVSLVSSLFVAGFVTLREEGGSGASGFTTFLIAWLTWFVCIACGGVTIFPVALACLRGLLAVIISPLMTLGSVLATICQQLCKEGPWEVSTLSHIARLFRVAWRKYEPNSLPFLLAAFFRRFAPPSSSSSSSSPSDPESQQPSWRSWFSFCGRFPVWCYTYPAILPHQAIADEWRRAVDLRPYPRDDAEDPSRVLPHSHERAIGRAMQSGGAVTPSKLFFIRRLLSYSSWYALLFAGALSFSEAGAGVQAVAFIIGAFGAVKAFCVWFLSLRSGGKYSSEMEAAAVLAIESDGEEEDTDDDDGNAEEKERGQQPGHLQGGSTATSEGAGTGKGAGAASLDLYRSSGVAGVAGRGGRGGVSSRHHLRSKKSATAIAIAAGSSATLRRIASIQAQEQADAEQAADAAEAAAETAGETEAESATEAETPAAGPADDGGETGTPHPHHRRRHRRRRGKKPGTVSAGQLALASRAKGVSGVIMTLLSPAKSPADAPPPTPSSARKNTKKGWTATSTTTAPPPPASGSPPSPSSVTAAAASSSPRSEETAAEDLTAAPPTTTTAVTAAGSGVPDASAAESAAAAAAAEMVAVAVSVPPEVAAAPPQPKGTNSEAGIVAQPVETTTTPTDHMPAAPETSGPVDTALSVSYLRALLNTTGLRWYHCHTPALKARRALKCAAWIGGLTLGLTALCIIVLLFGLAKPLGGWSCLVLLAFIGCSLLPHSSSTGCCFQLCKFAFALVAACAMFLAASFNGSLGTTPIIALNSTAPHVPFPPLQAYPVCSTNEAGLTVVDQCILSALAYKDDSLVASETQAWFNAPANVPFTVQPIFNFGPLSNASLAGTSLRFVLFSLQPTSFAPPSSNIQPSLILAIRGSADAPDFLTDIALWVASATMEAASLIAPINSWPLGLKRAVAVASEFMAEALNPRRLQSTASLLPPLNWNTILGPNANQAAAARASSASNVLGADNAASPSKAYYSLLVAFTKALQAATNGTIPLQIVGHSLGGGLAASLGQTVNAPAVSFSGPGVLVTAAALGVPPPLKQNLELVIMPQFDLVPRVDKHVGTVGNIFCGGTSASIAGCHAILRTCCELLASCGDPYGRSLLSCPSFGFNVTQAGLGY